MSKKEESPLVLLTRRVKALYLSTAAINWGIDPNPQISQADFSRCFNKAASEYRLTARQRQALIPLVRENTVKAIENLQRNQIQRPPHSKPREVPMVQKTPKCVHPDYYYEIRDAIILQMGPTFNLEDFKRLFPKAARPHNVIPYTDGYLAHRRIIGRLVENKMKTRFANLPKQQTALV